MPQPYTYLRTAKGAWDIIFKNSDISDACRLGALGTKPLRCYNLFHRRRTDMLVQAAEKIETDNCGDFLDALISLAKTSTEREYAMGFLAFYAADCSFRPYIAGVANTEKPYKGKHGKTRFAAALDTYFHAEDTGVAYVPGNEAMPKMSVALQAEICALINNAYNKAYGEKLSLEYLCDAFYEYKRLLNMQCSPSNKNGFSIWFHDSFAVKQGGLIKNSATPAAPPKHGFYSSWQNPYTMAEFTDNGPDAIMRQAVRVATGYMHTAQSFWTGRITIDNVRLVVGSNVYETGLPCK